MQCKLIFLFLALSMLCGCRGEEPTSNGDQPARLVAEQPRQKGCVGCHSAISSTPPHDLACSDCHRGDGQADLEKHAHQGLIAHPSHPDLMNGTCGRCHEDIVRKTSASSHFTLHNEINLVRTHYGSTEQLGQLTEIPVAPGSTSLLAIADDMLRRRCLRCHVYSTGDDYPLTGHGTGCAACHLPFAEGKLQSHQLIAKPTDQQCLSCHYGNFVGADYYGRYDHDFTWEYRTPFVTREQYLRPYGVEYHDLAPDIHQQRGLSCIDCHRGSQLMGGAGVALTCNSCHRAVTEQNGPLPDNVSMIEGALQLESSDGTTHVIPPLTHPAHAEYGQQVACQVCHAQWSFNDSTTHLLRSASDDYFTFEQLTVQGSSEVERLLEHNLNSDEEEMPPAMRDGITGEERPGVWYQGYTQRRWEDILIRRDSDGIIKVFRPILDLRLSAIDADEEVILDSVAGNGSGLLPYTPHTTGPAGMFYLHRFAALLDGPKPDESQ